MKISVIATSFLFCLARLAVKAGASALRATKDDLEPHWVTDVDIIVHGLGEVKDTAEDIQIVQECFVAAMNAVRKDDDFDVTELDITKVEYHNERVTDLVLGEKLLGIGFHTAPKLRSYGSSYGRYSGGGYWSRSGRRRAALAGDQELSSSAGKDKPSEYFFKKIHLVEKEFCRLLDESGDDFLVNSKDCAIVPASAGGVAMGSPFA